MSKGKMFVISGASGVGKGTVLKKMMQQRQDLTFSVSATTRPPRPDEIDGVHYYFVTHDTFREMIEKDQFLEYDEHNKNYYGTPRGQALEKMEKGIVLLDIEPKGAAQVRRTMPEATLIFIMPPSMEELERRLRGRGDTAPEAIEKRLAQARWELTQAPKYDYIIINENAEEAAKELLSVMTAEKCRAELRIHLLKEEK